MGFEIKKELSKEELDKILEKNGLKLEKDLTYKNLEITENENKNKQIMDFDIRINKKEQE